jgi:hypothetical protein
MVSAFALLAETDPVAYSQAILDHFHALVVGFVLPAYDVAVELGLETARAQVHHTLEGSLGEARALLWPLVPQLEEAELALLGEGLLRLGMSVLLYRATPPEQFRGDLEALVTGYRAQYARPAPR